MPHTGNSLTTPLHRHTFEDAKHQSRENRLSSAVPEASAKFSKTRRPWGLSLKAF